jgi:hypothetical protein
LKDKETSNWGAELQSVSKQVLPLGIWPLSFDGRYLLDLRAFYSETGSEVNRKGKDREKNNSSQKA